ncbi:hypothetical protein IWQ56_001364 [Coemansia nantahalensis]|nr:hypothetical protein IWQ56_001364 [Coemansia nantahalensis]
MPETDSEPEKTKPCAVLVIRDSSDDDDDFVSDPDDLPSRPRQPNKPAPHSAEVDRFLSTFEPMRALQMTQKSGSPGGPRHSQDLDSDLADFIVDDDDDVGDVGRGSGDSGHAGGFGVDLDGEDSSGGAGVGSDHPAGPAFTLGRPQGAMALMPEEFSQLDLPTSFKIYVQYLVYWIANDRSKPELSHDNARYFYLAYIAVARVIDSIEQSLVASSAWVDGFRVDLNRFPEYSATGIASVPGCEACHFRQNRTATFCVTLSGTPYSRLELAPPRSVEYLASSEADSDTADVAGDDGAGSMPAMYKVGRTCKQRSELCHELHHYFYHLAHYVDIALLPALSKEGANDQSDLNPDDLVSTLEEEGVIDRLFHDFKSLLTRAKAGFTT